MANASIKLGDSTANDDRQIRIADAMWSWWTQPLLVNDGRYTYSAPAGAYGQLKINIQDNFTGENKSYLVASGYETDDHNAGSIISDGSKVLVMYPGRRNPNDSNACYYKYFNASEEPTPGLTKLSGFNNYPELHRIGDEFIAFGRLTTGGGVPQWGYRISTWPLGTWSAEQTLIQTAYSWPYIASRRSVTQENTIILGLAWHPLNTDHPTRFVGYGRLQRSGGVGDWIFSSANDSANLSTGLDMPLASSDFEQVYVPSASEKVRLLSVGDDAMIIISWTATDFSDGMYKYCRKVGGVWQTQDIIASGRFMNQVNTIGYPLGATLGSDVNTVHVCRESGGFYFYETRVTADNGLTWTSTEQVRINDKEWQDLVVTRPVVEDLQDHNWGQDRSNMRVMSILGWYNEQNYTQWRVDAVDESWMRTNYQPYPYLSMNSPVIGNIVTTARSFDHRDANKEMIIDLASPATFVIESNAVVDYRTNQTKLLLSSIGADATVDAVNSVTLKGRDASGNFVSQLGGKLVMSAGSTVTFTLIDTNIWLVHGDHNGITP